MPDAMPDTPLSIRAMLPTEHGGAISRIGLDYQDHIAAGFFIKMLSDETLTEVWCDLHDDVVLIWSNGIVEYVQVKDEHLNQLWSISCITAQKEGRSMTSIFEKSLGHDACAEKAQFRIVTSLDVNNDLKPLTLERSLTVRETANGALTEITTALSSKFGTFSSRNKNGAAYWVENCLWEPRHTVDEVIAKNTLALTRFLHDRRDFLMPDQCNELYLKLVRKAYDASGPARNGDLSKAKVTRDSLCSWLNQYVQETLHPTDSGGGKKLAKKMESAQLSQADIDAALQQRSFYRIETIQQRYIPARERQLAEQEVLAQLQKLRSKLDSGQLKDDGPEFHSHCLDAMASIRTNWEIGTKPTESLLQGCMYDITNRCGHRFRRVTS